YNFGRHQHQDKFWQEVTKKLEADAQQHITNSLEALAWEGLGLREVTGAGKGSQQGQGEEEGAKEKMPETTAGTAMEVAMKAPAGGAKRLASPAKKTSLTKPASKHRGRQAPRYEVSSKIPLNLLFLLTLSDKQDLSNKELERLLVPRWAEAVVDTGIEVGVVLKKTKRKATVDLATCQAFKEEQKACDKCWADNNSEGC
ncbi:hypothetical protein C0993_002106, partial [Termitomyces sp. T159_Od127]